MQDVFNKLTAENNPYLNALKSDLEALNEYQQAAVYDHSRVLLLNAQVGSGKTTVLIHKVLYLHFIKGVPLERMAVLTFTNKAADEIKTRLREKNPEIKEESMRFFGTFHSVARTLLATVLPVDTLGYTKGFSICDGDEILAFYDRVINENELSVKYRSKLKKRMEMVRQGKLLYGNMKRDDDLQDFLKLLKEEKKRCNIMEFDDLLENAVLLLRESEFCPDWVVIDEFQDCDTAQLELIDCLHKGKSHLFAVGDPNQVIYSFRGSQRSLFNEFKKQYHANELTLPINYRSTGTILDAAKAFLEPGQPIRGIREEGKRISVKKHYNTFNEALYLSEKLKKLRDNGIDYGEMAVLYRKQKQCEVFRNVFENQGIPFEISLRKTLRDIPVLHFTARLLKAAVNTNDRDSLLYVLGDSRYSLGISGRQTKKLLQDFYDKTGSIPDFLKRVRDFEEWCGQLEIMPEANTVFDYFDLGSLLMPTSVTYREDQAIVMKFLQDILDYAAKGKAGTFEGIKAFMTNAALYGSQILNETADKARSAVKLLTLHASKGLEFKYVFISGANLGLIPIPAKSQEEEEEEKRLFFVGITRAKDYLEISYHANPEEFGVYGVPSPYLRMIPQELIESEDFGSRASSLSRLRREIKSNIESKKNGSEEAAIEPEKEEKKKVSHDKYGIGTVVSEDENAITVNFGVYGEKMFSKLFCPLKYMD